MSKNKEYNTGHAEMREKRKESYHTENKSIGRARESQENVTTQKVRRQYDDLRGLSSTNDIPKAVHSANNSVQENNCVPNSGNRGYRTEETTSRGHKPDEVPNRVYGADEPLSRVRKADEVPNRVHRADEPLNRVRKADEIPQRVYGTDEPLSKIHKTNETPDKVYRTDETLSKVHTSEGGLVSVDKASTTGLITAPKDDEMQIPQNGYDSKIHINLDSLNQAMIDTVKSKYEDTDMVRGYRETERIARLLGVGTIHRANSIATERDKLYRNTIEERRLRKNGDVSEIRVKELVGKTGGVYRDLNNRTHNVFNDYRNNMECIDRALRAKGIDGRTYNKSDIEKALSTGVAGNKRTGVILDSDTIVLLNEKKRLLGMEQSMRRAEHARGGVKNTAKAWVRESLGETDTAEGYRFAKQTYTTAKSLYKTGKKATGEVVKAGIGVGSATVRLGALGVEKAKGVDTKDFRNVVKHKEMRAKWTVGEYASTSTKYNVGKVVDVAGKVSVKSAKIIGKGAKWAGATAKHHWGATIGKTKAGKVIEKTLNNKVTRTVGRVISGTVNGGIKVTGKVYRGANVLNKGGRAVTRKVGNAFGFVTKPFRIFMKPFNLIADLTATLKKYLIYIVIGYAFITFFVLLICQSGIMFWNFIMGSPNIDSETENQGGDELKKRKAGEYVAEKIARKSFNLRNYIETGNMDGDEDAGILSKLLISIKSTTGFLDIPSNWKAKRDEVAELQKEHTTTVEVTEDLTNISPSNNNQNEEIEDENTEETEVVTYNKVIRARYTNCNVKDIEKYVLSCASMGFDSMNTPQDVYINYCMDLFDEIMNKATFTVLETDSTIDVHIDVLSDKKILFDTAIEVFNRAEYLYYYESELDEESIEFMCNYTDEEWNEYVCVTLVDNLADGYSSEEIETFMSGIKYKGSRADLVRGCLSLTNAGVSYVWGGGHTAPPSPWCDFQYVPKGMDCSGFVSYVLAYAGIKPYAYGTTCDYASGKMGGDVIYFENGIHVNDFEENGGSIKVGTLLVKTLTHADNHIIIYIGNGKVAESTTYNGVSGIQTNDITIKRISDGRYHFAIDMIDDSGETSEPQ